MLNLPELIEKLNACEKTTDELAVRVQVDDGDDGVILPIQSVEIGVDGRVYVRCWLN